MTMADETAPSEFTPPVTEPGPPAEPVAPPPDPVAPPPDPVEPIGPAATTIPSSSGASSNPVAGLLEHPKVVETVEQRPEALVGAAFAGGLLLATILKRLGR
jgi:hypothetical protein